MKLFKKTKEVVKYETLATIGTIGAVLSGIVAIGFLIWEDAKTREQLAKNEEKLKEMRAKRDEILKSGEEVREFIDKRQNGVYSVNGPISDKLSEFKNALRDAEDALNIVSAHDSDELYAAFDDLEDKISTFQKVCEQVDEVLSDQSIPDKERYAQALIILKDMELVDDDSAEEEEEEECDEGIDD